MWSWSTNVTDRQTDRQTDGRHTISIPRYALVHRAVKTNALTTTLRRWRNVVLTRIPANCGWNSQNDISYIYRAGCVIDDWRNIARWSLFARLLHLIMHRIKANIHSIIPVSRSKPVTSWCGQKSVVSVVSCRFPNSIRTTCSQQGGNKVASSPRLRGSYRKTRVLILGITLQAYRRIVPTAGYLSKTCR